ncbi:MAG: hypothetical protein ACAH17_03480 [Candidatus Paceibacterota bacterium]
MHTSLKQTSSLLNKNQPLSQVVTVEQEPRANHLLARLRKAKYLVQPSGFVTDFASDFWLHMEFSFCGNKSEVVVDQWWVTDSAGVELSLSKLSYEQVQFVALAMAEEFAYQTKYYYDELESEHYEMQSYRRHKFD